MNKLQSEKLLKLFNSVLKKDSGGAFNKTHGFYIKDGGAYAENIVCDFFKQNKLSGEDLNKTFHKSWKKVRDSSRFELYLEQIQHYLSTYGTDFRGEVYIPDEILDIPDVRLKVKVIEVLTKEEIVDKCLGLLTSGIALKEETIDDILGLLDSFKYQFTGKEGVKNKEAVIKIAERFGVLPYDVNGFLRYVVYRSTGSTLLIKNKDTYKKIKESSYNPQYDFVKFGEKRLAETFNRFKPLFLSYKSKCPSVINRISKLSKKYHKPLPLNPLNAVTSRELQKDDNLDKATLFAIFKALSACYSRMNGQDTFAYRIRNGKGFAAESDVHVGLCKYNYNFLLKHLKKRMGSQKSVYMPENVEYALPTSEKMFVGNIPTGTKFYGKRMAAGVYWKDSWGARDIDLSGVNISGKIGWNASYNHNDILLYSGDITSARNGAVEYLHASGKIEPTLVQTNVYNGKDDCEYKIVVGQGSRVSRDFMMNPNKLFAEIKCQGIQKQMVLGMMTQEEDKNCFVLLNFGAGSLRVSGNNRNSMMFNKALYQQWSDPLSLRKVLDELGWNTTEAEEDADVNLSLDSLEKDTFINLFG
jgi:hypothetical protein